MNRPNRCTDMSTDAEEKKLLFLQSRCISHELRNHLSICDLYTQIIKKHCDGGKCNEANISSVNNAVNCIQKSIRVMNNCLLDLKSLNNINPSRCELERLVEESVAMAQVYAPDAQITYDAQGEIYIDENKLCACLVNIIKNAIEAQADKVEIFARPDKISITNNGSKIENPEEIFNEGFTTKPTGSGLGLYICARNLEMQEAKLRLADSGGFEIILPNQ